jgi:hypothetical protein
VNLPPVFDALMEILRVRVFFLFLNAVELIDTSIGKSTGSTRYCRPTTRVDEIHERIERMVGA